MSVTASALVEPFADEVESDSRHNICCDVYEEQSDHKIHLLSKARGVNRKQIYFSEKFFAGQAVENFFGV